MGLWLVSIHTWLKDQGAASLADLYEGAVQLILEKHISGRLRFVAHAVREIRNRLPDCIIVGEKTGERLNYTEELKQILKTWEDSGFSLNSSPLVDTTTSDKASLSPSNRITIPLRLFANCKFSID